MKEIEIPNGSESKGFEYTIPDGMEAIIKDGKVIVRKKESDDERIRKQIEQALIEHDWSATYNISKDDCLSYLERQKDKVVEFDHDREQKPAEWSEEDEKMLDALISDYQFLSRKYRDEQKDFFTEFDLVKDDIKIVDWLKSLPERFNLQPKQELSDKDKEMFGRCIANAKKHIPIPDKNGHLAKIEERVDKELVDWLKERFFNLHWKPSEEQMKQLGWVAEQNKDNILGKGLMTLYNDLKKLM